MANHAFLDRAALLLRQNRPDEAYEFAQRALAADPNEVDVFLLLTQIELERERWDAAEAAARQAIELAPDMAAAHYVMSLVLYMRNRMKPALEAAQTAVSIDPWWAEGHGMRARVLMAMERYSDALAAAEAGLAVDPEDIGCNNIRALALVHLQRVDEAGATLQSTLAADPEETYTHANLGWTYLHAGNPGAAITHFQESLRLYPENEVARDGMIHALKARNPVYGAFLNSMLWLNRLGSTKRWVVLLAIFFGYPYLGRIGEMHPLLPFITTPLRWGILIFCVFSWVADPFFNAILMLSRDGRHALSRLAKVEAVIVLALVLAATVLIAGRLLLDLPPLEDLALATLALGILVDGWIKFKHPPYALLWRLGCILLLLLYGGVAWNYGQVALTALQPGTQILDILAPMQWGQKLLQWYFYGLIGVFVAYNILAAHRPRR